MRKMKDSGVPWIGEIPEGWEIRKTKQIFSVFNGSTPKSDNAEYWGGGIIWITPAEMGEHIDIIKDSKRTLTDLGLSSCGATIVHINSIIISSRAPIGQVSIAGSELCTNQGCKSLVNKYNINEKYFFYFFKIQSETLNMLGKGTTFLELSSFELENFLIPNPPLPEQHRIASYLDAKCAEIDRSMELMRQSIDKLKAYRMSVITEAVTKGLDPDVPMKDSGVPWIGEIPEGWEIRRFDTVAHVKSNLVSPFDYPDMPQISPENIEKHSNNLLNVKNVHESGIISGNHLFHKGQILYSKIRPILNKVVIAPFDGLCSADMYPIKSKIFAKYLLYAMMSDNFIAQVKQITELRVKMPKINQAELSKIFLYVPCDSEQRYLAAYLDAKCAEIDAIIAKKQELLDKLTAYKKSLIFECVTGKREVAA